MRIFGGKRGVYVVTGALLTILVVTSGSLLTYFLMAPEIEKAVDHNNIQVVRNNLIGLDTHIRELLLRSTNSTSIFKMTLPKGTITVNNTDDTVTFSVKTRLNYEIPAGLRSRGWSINKTDNDILSIRWQLPVDLVTKYTSIKPAMHIVTLSFEKEVIIKVDKWTLHKNTNLNFTRGSTTSNYYLSRINESDYGFDLDLNRDEDKNNSWLLCLFDPNEDYIFDTVAIKVSRDDRDPIDIVEEMTASEISQYFDIVEEGDSFRLGKNLTNPSQEIPLMVYKVRERYVILRYARIRMDLQ